MSPDLALALEIYRTLAAGGDDEYMHVVLIPGAPPSKARPKFTRNGRTYTSPESRAAEDRTALYLRSRIKSPMTGNLALGCVFFRPNRQRIDTDNMLKHVCDAGNGILWVDDSQVTAIFGRVEYDPANPRTIVVVGRHRSTMERGTDSVYPCAVCGTAIQRQGQTKMRKTCSRECAAAAKGHDVLTPVACESCGQSFARATRTARFCSPECRAASVRGKRKAAAPPLSCCTECGVELTHRRGGKCRECWRHPTNVQPTKETSP